MLHLQGLRCTCATGIILDIYQCPSSSIRPWRRKRRALITHWLKHSVSTMHTTGVIFPLFIFNLCSWLPQLVCVSIFGFFYSHSPDRCLTPLLKPTASHFTSYCSNFKIYTRYCRYWTDPRNSILTKRLCLLYFMRFFYIVSYTMEPSQYVRTTPKEPTKMGFDEVQMYFNN